MSNTTKVVILAVFVLVVVAAIFYARKTPPVAGVEQSQSVDTAMTGLPQIYANSKDGFSIHLPADYTVDESYTYQELGPGGSISGVKFTIASSTSAGTNLGSDSYISVEEIPAAPVCTAALFLQKGVTATLLNEGDRQYSIASSTGAAAGNRYEETVYAFPGTSPCMAVRYFIHYGVIDNYPAGTVQEFNEPALLAQFDAIRSTLTVSQ